MSKAPDMTAGMSARELVEEELIHGALRREQLWRMIGLGGAGFGVFGCLAAAAVALMVETPPPVIGRVRTRLAGIGLTATAALAVAVLSAPAAHAAGSSMPWEAPLQRILESIEGPVAKIVAVIIIIVTGLTLAFGDTAGGFRRLIQIVFGLSIAFAASSFFLSFFSFGGGALL